MIKILNICIFGTLLFCACNKLSPSIPLEDKTGYKVINNGTGAVESVTDQNDKTELHLVQTIPSATGDGYFANMPIMLFFDDKLILNSIYSNIEVRQDEAKVKGTIYVNETSDGFAILTFTPTVAFLPSKKIAVTIKKGLQDDGGNTMKEDASFSFLTKDISTITFDYNKDFERGPTGVSFIGDGGIMYKRAGCTVAPFQGDRYSAISTGYGICGGGAIGGASSLMILGPITPALSTFSFQYDFISSEFNEYVDAKYKIDDAAMVTVSGPIGTYSEVLTSVKRIGINGNTQCLFPQLPDGGDTYVGHTGWQHKTLSFRNVGTPAYIIFTVTDVGDLQLSSVLAVDSVAY